MNDNIYFYNIYFFFEFYINLSWNNCDIDFLRSWPFKVPFDKGKKSSKSTAIYDTISFSIFFMKSFKLEQIIIILK